MTNFEATQCEINRQTIFGTTMNAIIFYDLFDSAVRAKANLESAMHQVDETTQWNVRPWRLDLLTLPASADVALEEATDADLIVLAISQPQFLPIWLPDWLEQWAARRQVQEAALAVWDGGNGRLHSAPAARGLSQFAERHGLSLIFDGDAPAENESAILAHELHEREVSSPRHSGRPCNLRPSAASVPGQQRMKDTFNEFAKFPFRGRNNGGPARLMNNHSRQ